MGVAVGSGVGVAVGSGVGVAVGSGVGEGVGPSVGVGVGVGVGLAVGRGVFVGRAVGRGVRVGAGVAVGVAVGPVVGVAVGLGVGVRIAVGSAVGADVVGESVGIGVEESTSDVALGSGVPVAESTPPAGRGQNAKAAPKATKNNPTSPAAAEDSLARHGGSGVAATSGTWGATVSGWACRSRSSRGACCGRRAGHDESFRCHDRRPGPARPPRILLGRGQRHAGSLGASLGPGRGRPPEQPTDHVHADGRVDHIDRS